MQVDAALGPGRGELYVYIIPLPQVRALVNEHGKGIVGHVGIAHAAVEIVGGGEIAH